jgi:hypothetical protein
MAGNEEALEEYQWGRKWWNGGRTRVNSPKLPEVNDQAVSSCEAAKLADISVHISASSLA